MANILVLSASASAINCVNSLTEDDRLSVFVTDSNRYACGLYKGGVHPIVVPRARDLAAYQTALDSVIERFAIEILLPTSDRDIEGVVELLNHGWSPPVALFRPPYSAFQILGNKRRLGQFLSGSDVPLPYTYEAAENVRFPVVVKPAAEGGTKGVTIVRDAAKMNAAIQRLQFTHGNEYVVQEYVPGGTGSVYMVTMLYDQNGLLVSAVTMRSSLTFMTWGGGGNAGVIVDEPQTIRLAEEVIRLAGGWHGPICVEFKRHSGDDRFYLLEVNCRLNGYSYLTTMNGIDYPKAIVDLLLERHTNRLPRHPRSGARNFILGFREKVVDRFISS
jgi:predicted ATP-grasp superfamily ATP-dependent carboligase